MSDDEGEQIMYDVNDQREYDGYAESNANFAGGIDEGGRLQSHDLDGAITKEFTFYLEGSPVEIHANPEKAKWRILQEHLPFLKPNLSDTNRTAAPPEGTPGDLKRVIPLEVCITGYENLYDVPLGFNLPWNVPNAIGKGRHTFTLFANKTKEFDNPRKVFMPANVIDRQMYKELRRYDLEQLKGQILFDEDDQHEPVAIVRTNGLAFDTLLKNAHCYKLNPNELLEHSGAARVTIPYAAGKKLYDTLEQPVKDISKRFVDFTKLEGRFCREDNRPFNSEIGLVGASVNGMSNPNYDKRRLFQRRRAMVKAAITYVAY